MTLSYGFYNSSGGDRVYDAIEFSSIFDGILIDGIFESIGDAFDVTPNTGMNIYVGSGRAWFDHTWTLNTGSYSLTVTTADPSNPRIDVVALEVNQDDLVRANSLKIIAGTPAASPVPPTLTDSGTLHQYALAEIYVGAGVTSINAGNITNKIGVSTPYVSGVLETINATWLKSNPRPPFKNMFINGAMKVSQRGTVITSQTTPGYKRAPDRWYFDVSSLGEWILSQATDGPSLEGFQEAYKMSCSVADASPAASDYLRLSYFMEGIDAAPLCWGTAQAKSITISFWVRSALTGTYILEVLVPDASKSISKSYTINAANTWEYKEIVFAGETTDVPPQDYTTGIRVNFWAGAGSNFTSGSLQTSWGTTTSANRAVGQVNVGGSNTYDYSLTGVQMEIGTEATDFNHIPWDIEYDRCLRYYQKSFDYDDVPGDGLQSTYAFSGLCATVNTSVYVTIELMKELRAVPTFVPYKVNVGTTAGMWGMYISGWVSCTSTDLHASYPSTKQLVVTAGHTGLTIGNSYLVAGHYTVDAELYS